MFKQIDDRVFRLGHGWVLAEVSASFANSSDCCLYDGFASGVGSDDTPTISAGTIVMLMFVLNFTPGAEVCVNLAPMSTNLPGTKRECFYKYYSIDKSVFNLSSNKF